ncbi:hypothetical protein LAZ40_00030, partial [Cereibacter sphaeroides]|uniref:hypothetical protein n=1 Tax=Cereibacter sphaeroides TaxID=1063 RepID=UPI001F22C4B7
RERLACLIEEEVERVSRFVWLRQFEVGKNSTDMNRLLDRREFLQRLGLLAEVLKEVPPHQISRLHRLGERY